MEQFKCDGKTRRCQEMVWHDHVGWGRSLQCEFTAKDDFAAPDLNPTKCGVHSETAKKKRAAKSRESYDATMERLNRPQKRIEELERLLKEARDLHDEHCAALMDESCKAPWEEKP